MFDVIDVLEKMGQDAQWSFASDGDLQMALAATSIIPDAQAAIVSGNQAALQLLMGISPLNCMLSPVKETEDEEEEEEEEKLPGQEDVEIKQLLPDVLALVG